MGDATKADCLGGVDGSKNDGEGDMKVKQSAAERDENSASKRPSTLLSG